MRRVVKLGGSLLSRPRLQSELAAWLKQQPRAETLLIVGGGDLIDAVRKSDAADPDDSATVHWRCVELLETTFAEVCDWFPDWPAINFQHELQRAARAGFSIDQPTIVRVTAFYTPTHDFGLPTDWRTTTDAIAAALAIEVSADELVLLKSCAIDPRSRVADFADAGVVDEALPLIADRVTGIRIEKLPELVNDTGTT